MLPIGEFSKICSVTTKTLRYYDEIGLLKPIIVNEHNGYRFYDVKQLKTILFINKLKITSQKFISPSKSSTFAYSFTNAKRLLGRKSEEPLCIT